MENIGLENKCRKKIIFESEPLKSFDVEKKIVTPKCQNDFQYKIICRLKVKMVPEVVYLDDLEEYDYFYSVGFFINDYTILTCAHNLVQLPNTKRKSKLIASLITIYPSINGNFELINKIETDDYFVCKEFRDCDSNLKANVINDWGLIFLNQPYGQVLFNSKKDISFLKRNHLEIKKGNNNLNTIKKSLNFKLFESNNKLKFDYMSKIGYMTPIYNSSEIYNFLLDSILLNTNVSNNVNSLKSNYNLSIVNNTKETLDKSEKTNVFVNKLNDLTFENNSDSQSITSIDAKSKKYIAIVTYLCSNNIRFIEDTYFRQMNQYKKKLNSFFSEYQGVLSKKKEYLYSLEMQINRISSIKNDTKQTLNNNSSLLTDLNIKEIKSNSVFFENSYFNSEEKEIPFLNNHLINFEKKEKYLGIYFLSEYMSNRSANVLSNVTDGKIFFYEEKGDSPYLSSAFIEEEIISINNKIEIKGHFYNNENISSEPGKIKYCLTTHKTMSGSPVFIIHENKYYLYGFHSRSVINNKSDFKQKIKNMKIMNPDYDINDLKERYCEYNEGVIIDKNLIVNILRILEERSFCNKTMTDFVHPNKFIKNYQVYFLSYNNCDEKIFKLGIDDSVSISDLFKYLIMCISNIFLLSKYDFELELTNNFTDETISVVKYLEEGVILNDNKRTFKDYIFEKNETLYINYKGQKKSIMVSSDAKFINWLIESEENYLDYLKSLKKKTKKQGFFYENSYFRFKNQFFFKLKIKFNLNRLCEGLVEEDLKTILIDNILQNCISNTNLFAKKSEEKVEEIINSKRKSNITFHLQSQTKKLNNKNSLNAINISNHNEKMLDSYLKNVNQIVEKLKDILKFGKCFTEKVLCKCREILNIKLFK